MNKKGLIVLFLIFSAVLFSISGCDNSKDAADSFVFFTTYNLGLAPTFVPLTNERLEPLTDAIAEHEADIMCLQEVWLPEHLAAIQEAAEGQFPYAYSVPAEQKFTPNVPCTPADIAPFVSCVETNCSDLAAEDLTPCVIANCAGTLGALTASNAVCAGAVIAQVGKPLEEAVAAVTQPSGLFAYDGSNGLLMLSRFPLDDIQTLDFIDESTTNHRVALFGTLALLSEQHVLGCTHLTANLGASVPYTGPFSSWEEEGNIQAMDMISFAEDYADGRPLYLAGDFNCSIPDAGTGVTGDFEGNCQLFLDAGYNSPGMGQLGCSFCDDNLVNTAKGGGEGQLLVDHFFIKDPLTDEALQVEMVFDDIIEVDTSEGPKDTHLSDHFGVMVRIPL